MASTGKRFHLVPNERGAVFGIVTRTGVSGGSFFGLKKFETEPKKEFIASPTLSATLTIGFVITGGVIVGGVAGGRKGGGVSGDIVGGVAGDTEGPELGEGYGGCPPLPPPPEVGVRVRAGLQSVFTLKSA